MERRLAAILAADVVGYSRLMGQDEAGTLERLKSLRKDLVQPRIVERRGRIVKLMGDGLLAEFPSVVEAVQCAVDLQKALVGHEDALPDELRIRLRIGINLGDIIVEGSDIYGDGVNVAARLESFAKPGRVCISGDAYRQVRGKIEADFEDLGEHQVKNIDHPVQIFQLVLHGETDVGGAAQSTPGKTPALEPPDSPSIAVLPFENLSGDPEQEYFSDGLTGDIISHLSRFRDLFVIASNSSFAYKGKSVKVQDVCAELGVRYVLEGSVRRSQDRVRVSVQLVDGHSGRQLWTERYDRQFDDIFKVQDEVTEMVVGSLASGYGGRLRKAWQKRAREKNSDSALAFDYFLRGLDVLEGWTKEDNERGRALVEKAIEVDPSYAKAYGKLAWSHIMDAIEGWSDDYDASMRKGKDCAAKGIEVEDSESWPHWALAGYYFYSSQHDLAQLEFDRAVALNPNDADVLSDVGLYLSYVGKADEGLEYAAKGMRLNPHYPEYYAMQLGQIYFDARRYEDAVRTFQSLRSVSTTVSFLYLAASHAALGHLDEAKEAIRRVLAFDPNATLAKWASVRYAPYKKPEDLAHFRECLQKAGLPD